MWLLALLRAFGVKETIFPVETHPGGQRPRRTCAFRRTRPADSPRTRNNSDELLSTLEMVAVAHWDICTTGRIRPGLQNQHSQGRRGAVHHSGAITKTVPG